MGGVCLILFWSAFWDGFPCDMHVPSTQPGHLQGMGPPCWPWAPLCSDPSLHCPSPQFSFPQVKCPSHTGRHKTSLLLKENWYFPDIKVLNQQTPHRTLTCSTKWSQESLQAWLGLSIAINIAGKMLRGCHWSLLGACSSRQAPSPCSWGVPGQPAKHSPSPHAWLFYDNIQGIPGVILYQDNGIKCFPEALLI